MYLKIRSVQFKKIKTFEKIELNFHLTFNKKIKINRFLFNGILR